MRLRHKLGIGLALVAVFIVALGVAVLWFASGKAGLDWAVGEAGRRSEGRLVFEGTTGSLVGQMRAQRISYYDAGWRIVAEDVELGWSPRALLSGRLSIAAVTAARVLLELGASDATATLPPSLAIPWPVDIERVAIGRIDVISGANEWQVRGLALRYHGDAAGHRLEHLALDSDWGALRGELAVGANPPLPTTGVILFTGSDRLRGADGEIGITGNLGAASLALSTRALGAQASGIALVAPFEPVWLRQVTISGEALDLERFDASLPKTALRVGLSGGMADPSRFEARLEAFNGEAGPWSSGRLPFARGTTRFAFDGTSWTFDTLDVALAGQSRIRGDARIAADEFRGHIRVDQLDLAAVHARLHPTRLEGALDFQLSLAAGTPQGIVKGQLGERGVAYAFDGEFARGEVQIRTFRAEAKGGALAGSAKLEFTGPQRFSVDAAATRLDPAAFGAYPTASITGTVAARGMLKPAWSASLTAQLAPGSRWRKLALAGGGSADLAREHISNAAVDLSIGDNRLQAHGDYGREGDVLSFVLEASDLAAVDVDLAGRLHASGRVGGAWARPSLSVAARGEALRMASNTAATIVLDGDIGPRGTSEGDRTIRLNAELTELKTPSIALSRLTARLSGTVDQHELALTARGSDLDLDFDARLAGGWRVSPNDGWSGRIVALENRGQYPLALERAASLQWRRDHFRVVDAVGTISGGRFELRELAWDAGRLSSSGEFSGLPMAALLAATGQRARARSTVTLSGGWSFAAAPRLNGTLKVMRDAGDIAPGDAPELVLGLSRLEVAAESVNDRVHATLTARSRLADADVAVDIGPSPTAAGLFDEATPLKLSLHADAASLRAVQSLAGTTAIIDGRVTLDLSGQGTLRQVRLTGAVEGDALRVEAPQYGVFLHDGRVRARLDDRAVTVSDLSFAAGDGRFVASGRLPAIGAGDASGARVTWRAEKLRLLNRPDAHLVLSGEGTLALEQKKLALAGKLKAENGHFELRRRTADSLGEDVVVRGRDRQAPAGSARVPFAVNLELDFGERFEVIGEGLDAIVAGKVNVVTAPDGTLTGRGSINTERGTYTAFGQQLTIERGKLYFDGPLENPGLDLLAVRKNLQVEAGVEVTGTVRFPRVQLTSTPPVPDNEKLSWLVLGHGLDSASNADISALQIAFAAVTDPTATPLGQRVARTFGFDDISVRAADASRTTASGPAGQVVAISKRLTDNLSLIYEQGLSVANNAFKIEYAMTRSFTVRAEAGMVSGIGLYYSRSFD
jgi:translocation and assembly module TamB